jgi:hypothetical protein
MTTALVAAAIGGALRPRRIEHLQLYNTAAWLLGIPRETLRS